MRFTAEHIALLEQYKPHWITLRDLQFMTNLDRTILDELQRIHNEAIKVYHFSLWCGECVKEMVTILYTAYENYLKALPSVEPKLKKFKSIEK